MRKILLALIVVSAVSVTSCKKDSETAPVKSLKVNGGLNKNVDNSTVGTWE